MAVKRKGLTFRERLWKLWPPLSTLRHMGTGLAYGIVGTGEVVLDGSTAKALTTKQEGQIMANYRVISSDNHMFEPPDLWTSRAKPPFKRSKLMLKLKAPIAEHPE
jgi:hypothetical protein